MVIEPDTKVVQSHPRRQSSTQTPDLVGTLSPEAEGIEELVLDRLYDLTYPGNPPSQTLGPGPFGVALGRMDHLRSVALQPAPVVLYSLQALVGHLGSREGRAHAVRSLGSAAALTAKKVSARGWSAVEAGPKQKPVIIPEGSIAASRENPSYQPMLLDQPTSACPASQP